MKSNPTWEKWAAWLGREPKSGTIYKDVVDMRASRRVWEGFQTIVGVAPESGKKYSTFHSWVNGSYIRSQGLRFVVRSMSATTSCRSAVCSPTSPFSRTS